MNCVSSKFFVRRRPQNIQQNQRLPQPSSNVIQIDFSYLQNQSNFATGDPIYCTYCNSLLNSYSQPIRQDQKLIWRCQFCNAQNFLQQDQQELPTVPQLTYLLQNANYPQSSEDTSTVIFCIDISGSMSVTKPGSIPNIARPEDFQGLIQLCSDFRTSNGSTSVSRLGCVKAAIQAQLIELRRESPQKKIGVVFFSSGVRIIGDGLNQLGIQGAKLGNLEALRTEVENRHSEFFSQPIGQTAPLLAKKVYQTKASGPTALGPGLFISTLLAAQGGPGSKVILCTDGLANVGVGNFRKNDTSFYTHLAAYAEERGVSVSVISIQGQESNLQVLATLSQDTGGQVLKIAPQNLFKHFSSILEDKVIATQVSVQVMIHNALKFRNQKVSDLSWGDSRLFKKIGNATKNSSFTFELELKTEQELKFSQINIEGVQSVTVQALFQYRSLGGRKCLRSITKKQTLTQNLEQVKQEANFDILVRNANLQTNKMAQMGRFQAAKRNMMAWKQDLAMHATDSSRVQQLGEYQDWANNLQRNIQIQQQLEIEKGLQGDQDSAEFQEKRRKQYNDSMAYAGRMRVRKR